MSVPGYCIPGGGGGKNAESVYYPQVSLPKHPKGTSIGIFQPNAQNIPTFLLSKLQQLKPDFEE